MDKTLLLVDDEENIIRSLKRLLRRDGYRIFTADSGRKGLELLEDNEVGVIISDQRMPEMTGSEFLSIVKDRYPDTVRMVLSGYTDLKSVTDAINEGAIYKFFTKPWEDELLRKNVAEAFDYFELKGENERLTGELQAANEELSGINQDLERRIRESTFDLQRNMRALQVSQEVMEKMPVAVLGVAEDGLIAVANEAAHKCLASEKAGLVGRYAIEVLPQQAVDIYQNCNGEGCISERVEIVGRRVLDIRCCRMGNISDAKGWIMVLEPLINP